MKKLSLVFIMTISFVGCISAPKIVKTTSLPQRTVTVSYQDGFDNAEARKQCYLQARQYCGTKPKLMSEELRKELDGGIPVADGVPSTSEFIYITFLCD